MKVGQTDAHVLEHAHRVGLARIRAGSLYDPEQSLLDRDRAQVSRLSIRGDDAVSAVDVLGLRASRSEFHHERLIRLDLVGSG